jgi:UDP-N-acetylglucosamine acyltransferase
MWEAKAAVWCSPRSRLALSDPALVANAVIHPTAVIGDPPEHRDYKAMDPMYHPRIADSARIEALVTVDAGLFRPTSIGSRTWLMKKVHVGHDAIIGMGCEIAPLTSVGGEVMIGDRVKVGQGATFKPRVVVGSDAVIGMGAVVTKNVPAGETWVGNPARKL